MGLHYVGIGRGVWADVCNFMRMKKIWAKICVRGRATSTGAPARGGANVPPSASSSTANIAMSNSKDGAEIPAYGFSTAGVAAACSVAAIAFSDKSCTAAGEGSELLRRRSSCKTMPSRQPRQFCQVQPGFPGFRGNCLSTDVRVHPKAVISVAGATSFLFGGGSTSDADAVCRRCLSVGGNEKREVSELLPL